MKVIIIALILAISWPYISDMDYQDAIREAALYNDMVCTGAWPDYDNLNPNCD